ncbi:MAG: sodium:proton antiporter [Candidatus Neomarinimicrobiota bacterium]
MQNLKILILIIVLPAAALAAGDPGAVPHLNGESLSILWVIPFLGILFSISVLPLIAPHFWHQNFGKISFFWAILLIIPLFITQGLKVSIYELLHVTLLEFIPFIILLLALFTISGGVRLTGTLVGTPMVNTSMILIGTLLASWMGTTGAAMLLIRPLLRANKHRKKKVHIVVFFIFLVANIGGSLTPLGDPPLFLGFLKGIDFFWTTKAMLLPFIFMALALLIIFFVLDSYHYKNEKPVLIETGENFKLGLEGKVNLLLLSGVIGSVLLSGIWHPEINFSWAYVNLELQNIVRDLSLLVFTFLSWKLTSKDIRTANEYTWFPMLEVAKLFSAIFITIIPAIAILKSGTKGTLAGIIGAVTNDDGPVNSMYFWSTGILSSFLDNAPTYLVFFNTAGGDPQVLMGPLSQTLLAISMGAVFMGANTYIGNAPNFMVKSIAESSGLKMPSFFGYLFKWSIPILIPLFLVISFIFF